MACSRPLYRVGRRARCKSILNAVVVLYARALNNNWLLFWGVTPVLKLVFLASLKKLVGEVYFSNVKQE